jgi:hypothetical protein
VPPRERERLIRDFQGARGLESHEPAAAAARYEALLARHPSFAEAHFRLARLLEKQDRQIDAASHYLSALDHDGLAIRCPAPFRTTYFDVAARHPRSILIDGRRELAATSSTGLIGDEVIQDTHHPTLRGYAALAEAVLRELDRKQVFRQSRSFDLALDPVECAAHFGMDADRWATMCERTSEHYRRVAGYRYDPTERQEKARCYTDAARRLRGGTAVDDLGLPGIGVKPAARQSRH